MSNTISSHYRLIVSVVLVALAAMLALGAVQASHHITSGAAVAAAGAPGSTSGSPVNPDGTPWG